MEKHLNSPIDDIRCDGYKKPKVANNSALKKCV